MKRFRMEPNKPKLHEIKPEAALAAAVIATALTFLLVWLLAPQTSYVYALLFERTWIQYATVFFFWLTMSVLALKHLYSRYEQKAYESAKAVVSAPEFNATLIWSDADMVRDRFADDRHRQFHSSITFSRILNALDRLRKTQSTAAVGDYFRTRSDVDSSKLETSYTGIRFSVWLLPTLGLIGTVLGMGRGMSKFGGIILNAQNFQEIKTALPEVTNNLGTAFDTTFLALLLSAVAAFFMSLLQKRQEQILEEIDNLCFDDVSALFQEHSTASAEIVQALADKVHLIVERGNGNRAQLEHVIREELPAVLADRLQPAAQNVTGHLESIAQSVVQLVAAQGGMIGQNHDDTAHRSEEAVRTRTAVELAPRIDAMERTVSGHLENIARYAAQLAAGQRDATDRLVTEIREIKVAQKRAAEDIAALRENAGQALNALKQPR